MNTYLGNLVDLKAFYMNFVNINGSRRLQNKVKFCRLYLRIVSHVI